MKRREFIKGMLVTGGALACKPVLADGLPAQTPATEVKRVLVMFKCHLDVGFTDTQAAVMRKYFDQYFPQAIQVATTLRQSGEDRYIWTTGSWLLYEYLEQATSEQRKRVEQAVAAGDLAWHAMPFSWETEMLDRSMIVGALGLSQSLDRRFGRTTTGAKMSDVPGHSRGIVGPLAENGVKLLNIGVNGASTPPDVPSLFVWKDPDGASIMMMYHHKGYGGVVQVPGSDLAVAVEMRGDNGGPHSVDEIKKIYAELRKQFPNAKVTASNLSQIATAVEPYRSNLPVVTQEIGDTWIYGVPSDPVKVAHYREVSRLRREWIAQAKFRVGDSTDLGLLRRLLLAAEHTWGVDTKRLEDYDHYTPQDLAAARDKPKFRWAETSWAEKRKDIGEGITNLPEPLRAQAHKRIRALRRPSPNTLVSRRTRLGQRLKQPTSRLRSIRKPAPSAGCAPRRQGATGLRLNARWRCSLTRRSPRRTMIILLRATSWPRLGGRRWTSESPISNNSAPKAAYGCRRSPIAGQAKSQTAIGLSPSCISRMPRLSAPALSPGRRRCTSSCSWRMQSRQCR